MRNGGKKVHAVARDERLRQPLYMNSEFLNKAGLSLGMERSS